MSPKEIEDELLPIIEKNPGITLNGMFAYFKERLNGKFPPMYKVVMALRDSKKVKIDSKKKNTGHYLADVKIENEGVAKPPTPRQPTTSGDSSATFTTRFTRNRVEDKRYKLEKNEGAGWKPIDSNDLLEPIQTLYDQCIKMVPLRYRVRDTQDGVIIIERTEVATHSELTELSNAE